MIRTYSVGGLTIRVNAPAYDDPAYLSPFVLPDHDGPCDLSYTVRVGDEGDMTLPAGDPVSADRLRACYHTPEGSVRAFLDEWTGQAYLTDTTVGTEHEVVIDATRAGRLSVLLLKLFDLPHAIIPHGGIFLHASFIRYRGRALLFTAQKQVGKSTQAGLWEKYRGAEIVNGDRALLRRNPDGVWYAYGSPYCGTSGICRNVSCPLGGIVILSQSPTNKAARAGVRQAFAALLDGCSYDPSDAGEVNAVTSLCGGLIPEIPFYTLSCVPDESAVRTLEDIL